MPNPIILHTGIANTVLLYNTIVGLWALIKFLRNERIDGSFWGAVALGPILGIIQLILGLWLISLGLGVNVRFVHYLYGALVIISVPATFAFTNGRDDRGALLVYAAMFLLVAGFGIRGYTTGYGA
jgi:heme A synthase